MSFFKPLSDNGLHECCCTAVVYMYYQGLYDILVHST